MSRRLFGQTQHPPARSVVVGFRADAAEHRALREIARKEGVTITAFVRAALAERVRQLAPNTGGN